MPDPIDLDALETLAKKATPGPWTTSKSAHESEALCVDVPDGDDEMSLAWDSGFGITVMSRENAEYVAAAHPGVVLALIAEIRELLAHPLRHLANDGASVVIDTDAITENDQ